MTQLLLRLFVRGYKSPEDPEVHSAVGRMAGITGIFCNLALSLIKLIAGTLTGSIAIVADAANNLSDAVSSVVTLVGFHLAQKPADPSHPFGHARYEYLSGLGIAALILVVGIELGKSSLKKIIMPEPIVFSAVSIVILLVSILTKLWMWRFNLKLSDFIHSGTLRATAADSRNDAITTSAVLICCVISAVFHLNLDGIAGTAVACFILISGFHLIQDTISPLLGTKADEQLVDNLKEMILSHENILGVHDLLIHDYGPGHCFATAHVEIDAAIDPLASHDLMDHIEWSAKNKYNVQLVIHSDPVVVNDPRWDNMLTVVTRIVQKIDSRITVHDLRITNRKEERLVFDLGVPYDFSQDNDTLDDLIRSQLHQNGVTSSVAIHIDRQE